MIEETLAPEKQIGIIDQNPRLKFPKDKKTGIEKIEQKKQRPRSTETHAKPELHKLISVHDFKQVATETLTPKAWAFYSSAAADLLTHHNNADFYRRIMLRPRVMRDVTEADMTCTILGCPTSAPFFVSPAAMARLAYKDGELAIARGCANENIVQCISSNASYPLQTIVEAGSKNQAFFFQLYVNSDREKSVQLLHKARSLGIKAIFVTVDAHVPGKREADERLAADNTVASPISGAQASNDKMGGGMGRLMGQYIDRTLSWRDIAWIKKTSQLPIVIKGIQCAADAKKAVEYGCQGIVISNHGGRELDTAPPSILVLLEIHAICPDIFDQLEVYVDGGISRGSDILKAVALGAKAVGIGRPFLYSLCYGQDGVEHLSQIFKDELATSMRLSGITNLEQANPSMVNTSDIDHMVSRQEGHPWITRRLKARL